MTPVGLRFSSEAYILPNKITELLERRSNAKKEKNRIEDFIDRRDKQEDKKEDKEESADDGDTFFSRILGMGKSSQKDVSEKVVKSKKRKIEIAKKSNAWNVFGFGKND